MSARKIEPAGREKVTFMALACGMAPEQSTIAAFGASMQEEIVSLCRDILLVWEQQGLVGGTHVAVDGLQLSSPAAKGWSGTCADLRQQKTQWEETVKTLRAEPQRADQDGEPCHAAEQ